MEARGPGAWLPLMAGGEPEKSVTRPEWPSPTLVCQLQETGTVVLSGSLLITHAEGGMFRGVFFDKTGYVKASLDRELAKKLMVSAVPVKTERGGQAWLVEGVLLKCRYDALYGEVKVEEARKW